jgi:hypothetical protein
MKIFGIDQTGAVLNDKAAKPLKACQLVVDSSDQIKDILFFDIPHLGCWVQTLDQKQKTHIFIDCVLGLPISLNKAYSSQSLREWILKAGDFSFEDKIYGRQTSQKFFDEILDFYQIKNGELPRRDVEVKLNSNSVFTIHPFQKNIQTGTFRIWKELGSVLDSIVLWPSDFYLKDEFNIFLYEVYPSFFYKKLLNVKVRSAEPVLKYLEKLNLKISEKIRDQIYNPDNCDALMAAIGGLDCIKNNNVWDLQSEDIIFEGDILGS